jgi:hypothetical protein
LDAHGARHDHPDPRDRNGEAGLQVRVPPVHRPAVERTPGRARTVDYGLGILVGSGWLFQNPVINGYAGILAYLPSQRIAVVIEVTRGPKSTAQSIATDVFKALTQYLTPDNTIKT